MAFVKATKKAAKLRLAIAGPSRSGKTFSALRIASGLGKRIAFIDTERRSASKYAGDPNVPDFDVLEIDPPYSPTRAMAAIVEAGAGGYEVVIVDSMTHFWNGIGGFLELVDDEVKKMKAKGWKPDSFAAWKEVDPVYRRLIDTMLASPAHFIATMRAKTEYEKVENDRGKTEIKRVGMKPEMRDGYEYEFDVFGMMNADHQFVVHGTRCPAVDGAIVDRPGPKFVEPILSWLTGAPPRDDDEHAFARRIASASSPDELAATGAAVKAAELPAPARGRLGEIYRARDRELAPKRPASAPPSSPAAAAEEPPQREAAPEPPHSSPRAAAPSSVVLIDLSAIFWTKWHACAGQDFDAPAEQTIAAVHRLAEQADAAVICCDAGVSFRREISADYKANRPPKPEEARAQLARVVEQLSARYAALSADTFEADDVIATATAQARASGLGVVIASGDKDLLALVGDGVRMHSTHSGVTMGPAETWAKFGVSPSQIRDYLALCGDASDNVPGVEGIGPKTAASLLGAFGDLAGIVGEIAQDGEPRAPLTDRLRAKLREQWGRVDLSAALVTLRTDAPVNLIRALGLEEQAAA